jgi:hypothetical protein
VDAHELTAALAGAVAGLEQLAAQRAGLVGSLLGRWQGGYKDRFTAEYSAQQTRLTEQIETLRLLVGRVNQATAEAQAAMAARRSG